MVVEDETQDQEQELSELLQIRRDKLDQLRELGIDPFGGKFERTHQAKGIVDAYDNESKEDLETKGIEVRISRTDHGETRNG